MAVTGYKTTIYGLENILKWVSSIGPAIIFLSILKSYIFYATYGIRFTSYISFSEAVLLFLHEVAILLWFMLMVLTVVTLLFFVTRRFRKSLNIEEFIVPDSTSSFFHKIICIAVGLYP